MSTKNQRAAIKTMMTEKFSFVKRAIATVTAAGKQDFRLRPSRNFSNGGPGAGLDLL